MYTSVKVPSYYTYILYRYVSSYIYFWIKYRMKNYKYLYSYTFLYQYYIWDIIREIFPLRSGLKYNYIIILQFQNRF